MNQFEQRWCDFDPHDTESSEAKEIARTFWNACAAAAREKMPNTISAVPPLPLTPDALGWNRCLSTMAERLDELLSPEAPHD